jgi:hypothetical protein
MCQYRTQGVSGWGARRDSGGEGGVGGGGRDGEDRREEEAGSGSPAKLSRPITNVIHSKYSHVICNVQASNLEVRSQYM